MNKTGWQNSLQTEVEIFANTYGWGGNSIRIITLNIIPSIPAD